MRALRRRKDGGGLVEGWGGGGGLGGIFRRYGREILYWCGLGWGKGREKEVMAKWVGVGLSSQLGAAQERTSGVFPFASYSDLKFGVNNRNHPTRQGIGFYQAIFSPFGVMNCVQTFKAQSCCGIKLSSRRKTVVEELDCCRGFSGCLWQGILLLMVALQEEVVIKYHRTHQ